MAKSEDGRSQVRTLLIFVCFPYNPLKITEAFQVLKF